MTIKVERGAQTSGSADGALSRTVAGEVKRALMVSSAVELVPYGSLPRSERKTKRFFDNRRF